MYFYAINTHGMKRIIIFGLAVGLLSLQGCGEGGDKKAQKVDIVDQALSEQTQEEEVLPAEIVIQLLESIPSPVETSNLIKQTGSRYSTSYLNPVSNSNDYSSSVKQAINLGIYGADLGYTNIFEQNQDAIQYMEAVKKMADALQIGQFFDFVTIKRLATNKSNVDSLLNITQQNMQRINQHLQEKNKSHLSLLIITGGWIEGLYLTTKVVQQRPNDKLKDKIGEQKDVIANLVLLFEAFQSQPGFKQLHEDLLELNAVYSQVKITEEKTGEPKMVIVDGIPMIQDERVSTVYIRDEQIDEIARITGKIRDRFISI